MIHTTILIALLSSAINAMASERDDFVSRCQQSDPEMSGSIGYRACTGNYLRHLKQAQTALLSELNTSLASSKEEGNNPEAAKNSIANSQRNWLRFVEDHCLAAEHVFGVGNASGDVMPSCMVAQYEARNRQLKGMLEGNYER